MKKEFRLSIGLLSTVVLALLGVAFILSFERPPVDTVQRGYRGLGMVQVFNPRTEAKVAAANQVPAPEDKVDPAGQASSAAYQNVQVLKNVDSAEFLRLMTAVTSWVAPDQGCTYCHSADNLASDALYTKVVARRMFQMVEHINTTWKTHVGPAGVTCYTCHRGNPVPSYVWFNDPGPNHAGGFAQDYAGKNEVSVAAGLSSLPSDPFTPFLEQSNPIRVEATQALPGTDMSSIKQTDWTYALMFHFSSALGVNCTYCHNSRQFASWEQSTPQRITAWYGIRMVRDLNNSFMNPLKATFPHTRLGTLGDVAKINCQTCHQGVFKPLYGVSMLKDYPELGSDTAAP